MAVINFFRKNLVTRFLFFICGDIFFIALSIYLAFFLRFDGRIPQKYFPFIGEAILLAVIFLVPVFYFFGLYSFSWSYVSASELVSLFKATTGSFLFFVALVYILKYFSLLVYFPRSTIFVSYFLIFIFCGGFRFAKRVYLNQIRRGLKMGGERTLIIGAGDAGEQIARSIGNSKIISNQLVGFIDDNLAKQGVIIHGLKVLGRIDEMPEIIKNSKIQEIIIALPSAGTDIIKKAVELGRKSGIKNIKIAPSVSEIMDGRISVRDLREVQIEDLLGRKAASLDMGLINSFIKNKNILITGAAGSIGSELVRQATKFAPSSLTLVDWDETGIFNIFNELKRKSAELKIKSYLADIKDREKISAILKETKPDIIFHAAAYKHVPLMEEQPEEAIKNNIFGTKTVAEEAVLSGVSYLVNISTDKAVNPTSIMGATKRVCEMICQAKNKEGKTKFISVRFGNVLNSRGSVIPAFREQIKKGGPVEITHPEMKRYFMLTSEACLLVMQAGALGKGGEVFILNMGQLIKIVDLAKAMIKLSGFEPDKDIPIVFTQPRPGEKLFEEILTAEEGSGATASQEIFVAKLSDINIVDLEKQLSQMKLALKDKNNIKSILKNIIVSYKPV